MNQKALLALALAILIPSTAYFLLKYKTDSDVIMPRKYLLDTVISRQENGKMMSDSIWHVTKNITLINQLGDTVSLYDIKGKAIVADFFFTSCRSICPILTRNMARLQQSFLKGGDARQKPDTTIVQFLSFSIDPQRDSVMRLKQFADRFNVNHDNWWFLTGPRDSIYRFAFEEMKVDKYSMEPINPDFVHTSRFILMDKFYRVRGYYNGLDSTDLGKLARDIGLLMLEKDPGEKRKAF